MPYTDWKMEQNDEFVRKMNRDLSNGMNQRNRNNNMYMDYDNMNQRNVNSPINPYMNMNNPYGNRPYMYNNPQMYNPYFQNPWMWQNDNAAMYDEGEVERQAEKDLEYLIEMYPQTAKIIQNLIKDECDNMEYEGSVMYDEYPDRIMLRKICSRVRENYENMQNDNMQNQRNMRGESFETKEEGLVEGQDVEANNRRTGCNGNCGNSNNQTGIDDLIEVMLFNEMFRRRCRHNRCRRRGHGSRYR